MKNWSARSAIKYAAITIAVVVFAQIPGIASADLLSWTGRMPVVVYDYDVEMAGNWNDICVAKFQSAKEEVPINGMLPPYDTTDCLVSATENYSILYGVHTGLSIKFAGDVKAYLIRGVDCEHQRCLYLPSRDSLVVIESNNHIATGRVAVYKDFVKKLKIDRNSIVDQRFFSFENESPDALISDFFEPGDNGYNGYIKSMQKSDNDKWLVIEYANEAGFFRVDMDTMQMLKFADKTLSYAAAEYDITDDGQYIAVMGGATQNSIYDITQDCGEVYSVESIESDIKKRLQNPCQYVYVGNVSKNLSDPNDVLVPSMNSAFLPQFSDDGGELSYYATSYANPNLVKKITIRAANYSGPGPLEYLALGDSYSSGEGDTENDSKGNRYYRSYTDTHGSTDSPKERCHLSTRSYPYRLAAGMGLSADSWNTVACSGAVSWDVIGQGSRSYKGQWDRLKGFDVANLKTQALNEFIPGRQKQIEFVKRYKPKVITLTMGGNDVGFGPKIGDCAMFLATCDIVGSRRGDIASEINQQYENLKKLYEDLLSASEDNLKVYVLGYPIFINGDASANCSINVAFLNKEERELIFNSVVYLNRVIKQAAKAAGVKYIDIEHSLDGHRLCDEADKYVTGVTDGFDLSDNRQESFHPNAKGHQAIAISVWGNTWDSSMGKGESLLDYDTCSDTDENSCPDPSATKETIVVPDYFKNVDTNKNIKNRRMTISEQKKGIPIEITFDAFTFRPGASINAVIHSDPINLGQYLANADGGLNVKLDIPDDLSAGYHTLILTGQTYIGDPVEYEQTILVYGPDSEDLDEDGILDINDACLFVAASGIDQDTDGVDDICDAEIKVSSATRATSSYATGGENSADSTINNQEVREGKRGEMNNRWTLDAASIVVLGAILTVGYWQRGKLINYFKK